MNDSVAVDPLDDETVRRARERTAAAQKVIVKAGTNSLTDADSKLNRVKIDSLVGNIMSLRERGQDVLLVSSGAIGAGMGLLDQDTGTVEESQALSTVGQSHLMRHYTQSFDRYDQTIAQILLTKHDLADPVRFTNLHNTVKTLFDWNIVPIINENDAVATEEIQIGDNDMLSASVAIGIDVDLLVTLTDVDGVYTGNPKDDPGAELIEAVGANYVDVQALVNDSTNAEFGGIQTKIEGARDVSEHGIPAIIAGGGTERDILERIAAAKPVGTLFVPTDGATE